MMHGVDALADSVKPTLGPKSRLVILQRSFGSPLIVNDGATIAKEIELEDHLQNLGAKMVREVATKTNDVAGDGTTTALLLTTEAVVCLKPKERQGSKAELPEDEDWDD